ncbi:alpha/beta fold hydrolase [Mycobacterium arosiense]|uniref:Alpha/beta hydrolase n=1 Tax=Mycobacterium arosiense ATCC BAA-1401 = DSM 45069 TaxID=1265311 RepID=A0A1W9Z9L2_MYCAI|nr:alpha/beta fold hydrolase [Mycobacterium arosiense]ORA09988.1 alpha/beta hydrolase [Mycobacterium arosiense ATCC BAA-1401 = DSM 45069]
MTTQASPTTVAASDGVRLAVHAYPDIDPGRPTVLAIHGYPDNHHVWDGVAETLGRRFNFVAYDVRGAGESSKPTRQAGYRFPQLVSDIDAVIDSLGVGQVHLLAHDWGSIQAWAAVTDDAVMDKVASFTSISGPHLNYAGRFLRSARSPRGVVDVLKQALASSYIWFFLCPGVPELAIWSRATVAVFAAVELIGRPRGAEQRRAATSRSIRDYLNGLNLYRANMPKPMLAPGKRLPQTTVAVQVLVARRDYFVLSALQRFTGSIPEGGRVVPIEGGHWVVSAYPEVIARLTGEWIDLIAQSAGRRGIDSM